MQKPGPDGAAGTARPLSIAPAQGEGVDVSHQAEAEKHRAGDVPPPRWSRYLWAKFSFLEGFGTAMDCRRYGAELAFLINLLA